MPDSFMCVSIPQELFQFKNPSNVELASFGTGTNGVRIVEGRNGIVEHVDYYFASGELVKQIYYAASSISHIKHFRDNILYQEEHYSDEKLVSRGTFDKSGNLICGVAYEYNRQGNIIRIKKSQGGSTYSFSYGYDELMRVNARSISHNSKNIFNQKYHFDILDRVVEYEDDCQKISVDKMTPKGELISYKIIDKIGNNNISIENNLVENYYIDTEITLNGHKAKKVSRSYMDNIYLKRPYTTEEDIDLVIANLFNSQHALTKRTTNADIVNNVIANNIERRAIPISIRKRLLYNQVVNL